MNPADIQGFLTEAEGAALQEVTKGKVVLEVGTWKGRSTAFMAEVAKEVWTVDHFFGDEWAGKAFTLPDFVNTLHGMAHRDRVRVLIGNHREMLDRLNLSRFDVLFYDGDHSGKETEWALDLWVSRNRRGFDPATTVCVHDYGHPHMPQVKTTVDKWAEVFQFTIRTVDQLAILTPQEP